MAKPSTPSRAPRNAPQRKPHRYIDALFTDDFGRQSLLTTSSANGFAKKKLDRAAQSVQLQAERNAKTARRIEIREWRAAERGIAAEQREGDYRNRLMWRSLKTKVRPEKKMRYSPPKARKREWPYAAVALPKYSGPFLDRRGQRGVFMRMRYYSRRTAGQGVSQRVIKYCFNGAELDAQGNPYVATNIGANIDEALCGFDHLEQVNWAAQKNAKLLMHGIMAVDHRQRPDEMMTCGLRWAEETLGRFDLPYLVTLHAPPSDGDQRNWHLHVLWSFRPMIRTGDHEWQVAEMLRTDLDNPAAMKLFREMFASVMTEMSYETGQNQVWTAKSNADRGLPHEPQVHLGGADTSRARNGEYVAANEENHERVMRSKAAAIDDNLRHADEALAKMQHAARAIAARFARLPALPMRLPERVAASTMSLEPPSFGPAPPISTASLAVTALPQPAIVPARISKGAVKLPTVGPPRPSTIEVRASPVPQPLPRPARLGFANLRIRPLMPSAALIRPMPKIPAARSEPSIPKISPLPTPKLLPLANTMDRTSAPLSGARPIIPQLPTSVTSYSLVRLADTAIVDRATNRAEEVRKRDDERRERDADAIARAVQAARTVAGQRAAIERQAVEERAETTTARKRAWRLAREKRQQAMADWDDINRLDEVSLARPGRELRRPSEDRSAARPKAAHWHSRKPGQGIGD